MTSTYTIEVDNSWDAIETAPDATEAVKQLFPVADSIRYQGVDEIDGLAIYSYLVHTDGEYLNVEVSAR